MTLQVFTLPDLGEGLTEAELVRWLVAVGDSVAVDAPVAEVETAKALVEVPSPYAGVIARLHGDQGSTIAVGAPLIEVDPSGDGAVPATATPEAATPEAASYVEEERAGSGNVLIGYGTSEQPATGRRRLRRRSASNPPPDRPVPDRPPSDRLPSDRPVPDRRMPDGPMPDRSMPDRPMPDRLPSDRPGADRPGVADRPRVKSPLVRQLARREGVDLRALVGSGPTGLITRADVERATATPPATPEPDPPSPEEADRRTGLAIRERIALRGVRKVIADTLQRSRTEIPEATTWVDVDATDLIKLRASLAVGDQRPPSLLAFLARFAVTGLRVFPELNARVDAERGEIVQWDGVNLGIATQTDRGLMVPAVAGADRLSVRAMDAEIRRVTEAARAGTASSGELTRGSFTLNNYGVYGVDGSAAIINYPEVAIFGIGRIIQRPWVVDGAVVPRHIGQLSLVFDHRACDGAASGGFLRHVADAVEHPLSALVDS